MQLKQFLFFNALLYSSCVLAFKTKVSFILTETNASPNEEATGSSSTNLLFTNKNDFLEASIFICVLEEYALFTYLVKMDVLGESVMNGSKEVVFNDESINNKDYDNKNNTSLENIKDAINYSLQIK
ncbi:hypothetical protein HEP_00484500, partial [Hepatocystis sp. ex Piliocolobus tephrosceles]